ncbi:hypothetical protein [Clostridium vincentii]|nr:hypothetical protein [Clostridium vincentii]
MKLVIVVGLFYIRKSNRINYNIMMKNQKTNLINIIGRVGEDCERYYV